MVCLGAQLSEIEPHPRKLIFVGGLGRSGTSFIASRLGRHPDICLLPEIELKLLTEKNGLLDLFHALVQTYSPNRATVAVEQFKTFFLALVDGRFGQSGLASISPRDDWLFVLDTFLEELTVDGQAGPVQAKTVYSAARRLLWRIAEMAARKEPTGSEPTTFLEKTPHMLLAINFLANIAPGAQYVHVMRDPRSIARSLQNMNWGPSDLAACCTWVANYLEAWMKAQWTAAQKGIFPVSIQIEAIAQNPGLWSELICQQLALPQRRDLFGEADTRTLNGWVKQCSVADLEMLEARLSSWAAHFGYSTAIVGSPVCASVVPADVGCT